MKRFLAICALVLMLSLMSGTAAAQGCTMCYTAASQQSAKGKRALDVGILVLLTPALCIFCGVFYAAWRHRGDSSEEEF